MSEFKLVPASMLLDKETIGAINFHCGDGADGQFGEYSDGLLWVGTVTDDDGKEVYGLHLATSEYPEEGSTTLVEFAAPVPPDGGDLEGMPERMVAFSGKSENAIYSTRTWNACYDAFMPVVTRLQAENAALQQRLNAADQRIDEQVAELAKVRLGPCKLIFGDELP
ncbi:hypothetical protein RG836_00370 [Pseudomonas sp. SZMC_28357]|uniref:hypothetical protein n=1 Tax=Pseudomonas sp. SZMC_28357 TaxID=3074380 RepID=UPI002871669B|nr:hypothetical protein [Pseudomonas sp. SZMC_28357]MDR9749887.1 hypothetical protein [Pseudomonas sp. SZMC_28357]